MRMNLTDPVIGTELVRYLCSKCGVGFVLVEMRMNLTDPMTGTELVRYLRFKGDLGL